MFESGNYAYTSDRGFKRTCAPHAKELNLPFFIITFGKNMYEKKIDWKSPTKCILLYSKKGCGRAFVDGKWEEMPEGSLLYVTSMQSVKYEPIDENPWYTAYITFSGGSAESMLSQKTHVFGGDHSYIDDAVDKLLYAYGQDDFYEQSNSTLYFILLKLRRLTEGSEVVYSSKSNTASLIAKSIKYILEKFTEDITLSFLAEGCGVSEEYYCRAFKKITGTNPVAYVNSLRIARACDLLKQHPDMLIDAIAKECGFSSSSYFNKVFKKTMGMSPSAYKSAKNDNEQ